VTCLTNNQSSDEYYEIAHLMIIEDDTAYFLGFRIHPTIGSELSTLQRYSHRATVEKETIKKHVMIDKVEAINCDSVVFQESSTVMRTLERETTSIEHYC
jgi:hypothetical protein